jgi:hypothetical protein
MKRKPLRVIFLALFIAILPTVYAQTDSQERKPFESSMQVMVGKIANLFGNRQYAEAKFMQARSLDAENQNAQTELERLHVKTGKKTTMDGLRRERRITEAQVATKKPVRRSAIIREEKDMFGRPAGTYEKSLKELSEKSKFIHPKSVRIKNARAYTGGSGNSSSRSSGGDIGVVHGYLVNSNTGERRSMSASEAVSQGYEKQV